MGQPTFTVFVDNVGPTPHAFIKLDDGNGNSEHYGFAPRTPGSPHGPGNVGTGLTTHVIGDPQNSAAGYIDDVGWSKTITITSAQYNAMNDAVNTWDGAKHTYDALRLLGGENCTGFVQFVAQAGGITEINTSWAVLPINLIPVAERSALWVTDMDGQRSQSDVLKDPLHTPGTPAYEYKQAHPEMFVPPAGGSGTQDPNTSELYWNADGTYTQVSTQAGGGSAGDSQSIRVAADGHLIQVTETDGAHDNADYASRTTTYDAQGRVDSVNNVNDDGTRNWTDDDQDSTQPWTRVESRFDAQGREDYATVFEDDGGRTWYDYDQTNARADSLWQTRTDAQGREDWTRVTSDDASISWYDYDQANTRGDSLTQIQFDAQGRQDWANVTMDDGGRTWWDYDQANTRADGLTQIQFDAQGRQDWANVFEDDGGRTWYDYDQTNARADSLWQTRIDAQGREDWTRVTQDDASVSWYDYDQDHTRADSLTQIQFDAQGRQDWTNVTLDDGARTWYDYDQANARGDSLTQMQFDAQGRQDWANVLQDNGSRDLIDYDQDGSQGWTRVESHYDAQGRTDFSNMFTDDGGRNVYDYDQDGSHGWGRIETRFNTLGWRDYETRYFDDGSRFFVDYDYYGLNQHKLLAYNALGQATYLGEEVNGFVSTVFGSWNPAWGEGLGVQFVMPASGAMPPPGSLTSPSPFSYYDEPVGYVEVGPLQPV